MSDLSLPFDTKYMPLAKLQEMHRRSLESPEEFWAEQARQLDWFKPWDKVLEWDLPFARWFVGGQLNASYICVDHHVKSWRRSKVAIYWEGESGDRNRRVLSYSTLYAELNRFAALLKKLGINKGDRVALYMPMLPELPIFMLACARLGAIHTVVFSGFSAQALADRINDVQAKMLITADGGFRRGKVIPLKTTADEALASCPSIEHVIVVKRADNPVTMKEGRDLWLHEQLEPEMHYVPPEPVESNHPLYVLYTSGTTGKPKGIVHSTGGYLVHNYCTYKWVFNIKEESVYWCTADVGWVTGHSEIVYAPLAHGAAIVIYEGAPDYPDVDRWWRIIEKYGVSIFYTSPTAIRMLKGFGEKEADKHDLSSLELLGSVGEPISPEAWLWFYKHIGKERCPIVDTWWQTETGTIMISPAPGIECAPLKAGSATYPLPGVDAEVVDEAGNPVPPETRGYLVLKKPWPGMMLGIHNNPDRYKTTYWERFPGKYLSGDYAVTDRDGYFWILGRADEVLKIAGHRLGIAELEAAAASHPSIAEAAVTGKSDPVKGESIVVFARLKPEFTPSPQARQDMIAHLRKVVGPIATPEAVYFTTKLPKTRSGKIMRRILKAVVENTPSGDISTLEDETAVEEVIKSFREQSAEQQGRTVSTG